MRKLYSKNKWRFFLDTVFIECIVSHDSFLISFIELYIFIFCYVTAAHKLCYY